MILPYKPNIKSWDNARLKVLVPWQYEFEESFLVKARLYSSTVKIDCNSLSDFDKYILKIALFKYTLNATALGGIKANVKVLDEAYYHFYDSDTHCNLPKFYEKILDNHKSINHQFFLVIVLYIPTPSTGETEILEFIKKKAEELFFSSF